jgi:D-sedoheptulose 7-phosphate isomerase
MDHYQIISGNFQATIESIAMSVDQLAEPLSQASEMMSGALLQDRKILCCGEGADAALATLFTSHLLGHFERERPSLPALCLASDSASLMAISAGSGQEEIFSRQVRALGQSGDVLFCIDSAPVPGDSLRRAMQSADERGMAVIALLRNADNVLAGGVAIGVNAARRHRAIELYTTIIHCLCELIDHNLFGPNHQEI